MQCLCWQELEDWLGSVVHNGVTLCLCISLGRFLIYFWLFFCFLAGVCFCVKKKKKKKKGGGVGGVETKWNGQKRNETWCQCVRKGESVKWNKIGITWFETIKAKAQLYAVIFMGIWNIHVGGWNQADRSPTVPLHLFWEITQCAGHNHFSMIVYSTVIQSAPRCHLSTYTAPTQLYLNLLWKFVNMLFLTNRAIKFKDRVSHQRSCSHYSNILKMTSDLWLLVHLRTAWASLLSTFHVLQSLLATGHPSGHLKG